MIYLEFWNSNDFGGVVYDGPEGVFKQSLRLPVVIQAPKYQIVEQGQKKDGRFLLADSVSFKVHTARAIIPEYLADALQRATQCDNVFVDYERISSFTFTSRRIRDGLLDVGLEFITDVVIKSQLGVMRIDRQYLKINGDHRLLIGNGKKLFIQ